jgi:hypothetical protein
MAEVGIGANGIGCPPVILGPNLGRLFSRSTSRAALAKAAHDLSWREPVAAIGVILVFLVVVGALNLIEFGRLD